MLKQENFSLALPEICSLPPKNSEQAEIQLKSVKNNPPKPLVLVFSKDVDTLYLFKTFLKILDFEVALAENKIELIEAALTKRPDLILMDVHLPFSDSLTTMRGLLEEETFEKVPFVLLSGLPQKGFRRAAFAAGASEYLIKPIDFDLLEYSLQLILSDTRGDGHQGGAL